MSRTATPHPDDQTLVRRCREGDIEAADILFRRYHQTAVRMAAKETRSLDPEELASEALIRVWVAMRGGGGPQHAFPPYLRATIRNLAATWATQNREDPAEAEQLDAAMSRAHDEPGFDSAVVEHQVMMEAFDSLPERWRSVLWMTEIEGLRAAEVGERLGLTPNSAAALSKRARGALSRAWLQAHVERHGGGDECEWVLDRLAAYVKDGLTDAQDQRVRDHLDECSDCAGAMRRIAHLGASLRVAALIVGGSAAGVTAWTLTGTQVAAAATIGQASAGASGAKAFFRTIRRAADRSGMVTATAAVTVVAVAAVAFGAASGTGQPDAGQAPVAALPPASGGFGSGGQGGSSGSGAAASASTAAASTAAATPDATSEQATQTDPSTSPDGTTASVADSDAGTDPSATHVVTVRPTPSAAPSRPTPSQTATSTTASPGTTSPTARPSSPATTPTSSAPTPSVTPTVPTPTVPTPTVPTPTVPTPTVPTPTVPTPTVPTPTVPTPTVPSPGCSWVHATPPTSGTCYVVDDWIVCCWI
ncbi:sigma-70 family RNA polymerase sigma factor [Propionicicella superfundia]|uniref:sigma-70 family RNA polymerase sigma factor n=1 Tax=Propionicicella superfundia TaxID=348582 RepID=UPI00042582CB|nr:sigma-70 family RNA polymerase sigma factor [Propionicicella superfundia]